MNLMKKALLSIIAIEGLVLVQLLVLNNWNDIDVMSKDREVVPQKRVSPHLFKTPSFSFQERKSLLNSFREIEKSMKDIVNKHGLDFLYSKRVHSKMTLSIEEYAKKFLDTPYVWGATGPDKFDCSGFTKKIYAQSGITLPRHSTRQAKVGQYIEYENLERGDMVFFDTEKKRTGVVNHVGIYLEDGKFIHASSGNKRVVITDFNKKPFYKNRFLWGRRVVKSTILKPLPSLSQKGIEFLKGTFDLKEKRQASHDLETNTLALASF